MRTFPLRLLCLLVTGFAPAAEPATTLPPEVRLIANLVPDYPKYGQIPAGLPFKRAVKAVITAASAEPWQQRIYARLPNPVRKGDLLAIDLWVRGMSPDTQLHVCILERRAPFTSTAKRQWSPGDAWEHMVIAGRSPADYEASDLALQVSLGYGKQTIGLSEINVANFGQTSLTPEQVTTALTAPAKR